MNGFRVTILVLLALALALMFYVVTVFIPATRANHDEYMEALLDADYQKKAQEHRARMTQMYPSFEEPAAVERERAEFARRAEEREREAKEREEARILEEGKRVEEARRRQETEESSRREQGAAVRPLALVTAYDHENNIMMLKPMTEDGMLAAGQMLAIRRNGGVLCEIVVEERDPESGQYSAYVKDSSARAVLAGADYQPRLGDEVTVSTLPQIGDLPTLRTGAENAQPAIGEGVVIPASSSEEPVKSSQMEEADIQMIPVQP